MKTYILNCFLESDLIVSPPSQLNQLLLSRKQPSRAAYYECPWVGASERTPPVSRVWEAAAVLISGPERAPRTPAALIHPIAYHVDGTVVVRVRVSRVSCVLGSTGNSGGQVSTVSSPVSSPLTSDRLLYSGGQGMTGRSVGVPVTRLP